MNVVIDVYTRDTSTDFGRFKTEENSTNVFFIFFFTDYYYLTVIHHTLTATEYNSGNNIVRSREE